MTRDEVLAMKPGRELDALIAEKVMGWTYGHPCPEGMDCLHWVDEKGKVRGYKPPHYSTDIASAWEVVEKLLEKGDEMMGPDIFCYKNQTVVIIRRSAIKVHAQTAPEAICKAALLAVMGGC